MRDPKTILDGKDMNQDIHQLVGYVWTHGATAGVSAEFPSSEMIALCEEFLRKHREPASE